ncbi:hypothetical protein C8R44DRAFT_851192 [Mycena epipterygia]|nr:hypothetical protein C8R44DRAFT_851192 [Mycena epipterygia]
MLSCRVKRQPDALFRPPLDAWWMEELRRFSVQIGGAKEQIDSGLQLSCRGPVPSSASFRMYPLSNACPHYPPWSHAAHALHPAPRTPPTPQLDSGNPLTRTRWERCGECEVFVVRYLTQPVPAAGIAACRAQPHQRIPISVSTHFAVGMAQLVPQARLCYNFFVLVVAGDVESALMAVCQMWKEASTRRDTNAVQSRYMARPDGFS